MWKTWKKWNFLPRNSIALTLSKPSSVLICAKLQWKFFFRIHLTLTPPRRNAALICINRCGDWVQIFCWNSISLRASKSSTEFICMKNCPKKSSKSDFFQKFPLFHWNFHAQEWNFPLPPILSNSEYWVIHYLSICYSLFWVIPPILSICYSLGYRQNVTYSLRTVLFRFSHINTYVRHVPDWK